MFEYQWVAIRKMHTNEQYYPCHSYHEQNVFQVVGSIKYYVQKSWDGDAISALLKILRGDPAPAHEALDEIASSIPALLHSLPPTMPARPLPMFTHDKGARLYALLHLKWPHFRSSFRRVGRDVYLTSPMYV